MKNNIFKNYVGSDKNGKPVVFDCSDFNEADLVLMLKQPANLTPVNFKTGHSIWADHTSDLFNSNIEECIAWGNLGFAQALASLGYRVIPEKTEIN